MLVAGAAKVLRPDSAVEALRVAGLAPPSFVVRLGAGLEALVALAALVFPGPISSLLVGVSFLLFAAFILVLRRRPGVESCGSSEPAMSLRR